jgi:flavin reductase (DIM6/NTAB) family NADH-FMN oxidoreductase RutF
MPVTTGEFRKAMGQFATGVTVITVTRDSERVHGMTANSFTSVSLDPLQVLVCVDHRAQTHQFVQERKLFGINILAENQEELARYFAKPEQDPEIAARLGVRMRSSDRGTPLLDGAIVQLDCRLANVVQSGDHSIFIADVHGLEMHEGRPLVFHAGQYKRLPIAE